MRHVSTRPLLPLAILGLVAACSTTSGANPQPSSMASLPPLGSPTADIEMQDYLFAPAEIVISTGETVRWTNRGQAPHSATADDGSIDTGQIAAGESVARSFTEAGSFTYFCTVHPTMRGTIMVGSGTTSSMPPTTPAPSPSTSTATPSADPSVAPPSEPAPGEPSRFDVPLTIATDHSVAVKVIDWTGLVTSATSGVPGDGASVPFDAVEVANDGPSTLVVTWVGGPCDRTSTLVFDADRSTITVVQEPCQGDSIGFDRIVRLEVDEPVDAGSITGVLQAGGDTPG